MDNLTAKLYQSSKTVFTNKDLALIWQETNQNNLKTKINYYIKQGSLIRLTRGVFAKDKDYDSKELAASLYIPSYVSFETVLREAGIVFQYYETIFVAGPWSRSVAIDETKIKIRKIKDSVLFNPAGIDNRGNYSIATKERAFLDTIYLSPGYYFDNLRSIDWEKCFEIVKIYDNHQLVKRLKEYQKQNAE